MCYALAISEHIEMVEDSAALVCDRQIVMLIGPDRHIWYGTSQSCQDTADKPRGGKPGKVFVW